MERRGCHFCDNVRTRKRYPQFGDIVCCPECLKTRTISDYRLTNDYFIKEEVFQDLPHTTADLWSKYAGSYTLNFYWTATIVDRIGKSLTQHLDEIREQQKREADAKAAHKKEADNKRKADIKLQKRAKKQEIAIAKAFIKSHGINLNEAKETHTYNKMIMPNAVMTLPDIITMKSEIVAYRLRKPKQQWLHTRDDYDHICNDNEILRLLNTPSITLPQFQMLVEPMAVHIKKRDYLQTQNVPYKCHLFDIIDYYDTLDDLREAVEHIATLYNKYKSLSYPEPLKGPYMKWLNTIVASLPTVSLSQEQITDLQASFMPISTNLKSWGQPLELKSNLLHRIFKRIIDKNLTDKPFADVLLDNFTAELPTKVLINVFLQSGRYEYNVRCSLQCGMFDIYTYVQEFHPKTIIVSKNSIINIDKHKIAVLQVLAKIKIPSYLIWGLIYNSAEFTSYKHLPRTHVCDSCFKTTEIPLVSVRFPGIVLCDECTSLEEYDPYKWEEGWY